LLAPLCFGWGEEQHGLRANLVPLLKRIDQPQKQNIFKFVLVHPFQDGRPITILKWNTPLEKTLYGSIFDVFHSETGEPAQYIGRKGKRILPDDINEARQNFVTIQPGQSISIDFDLASAYRLPNENDTHTEYNVTLNTYVSFFTGVLGDGKELGMFQQQSHFDLLSAAPLISDTIHMNLLIPIPHEREHKLRVDYICSAPRITAFTNVIKLAQKNTDQAVNFLARANCDRTYVTWFGNYVSTSRWSTVQRHFLNAQSRFASGAYKLQCEVCDSGVLAYVYPNDRTHTIHFCDYSWQTPLLDQSSTLIHEMTHFIDVGNTDDYVYGKAAAQQLARSSPDKATMCAENHNFFAEVFPSCP